MNSKYSMYSDLDDISALVKVLSHDLIEFDDYRFELKKSKKYFDIFFCEGRCTDNCKILIKRECNTKNFFRPSKQKKWKHPHISETKQKKIGENRKKWEEDRKKKIEIDKQKRRSEYDQHYNIDRARKLLPLSPVENLPDEVIILIASRYLTGEDMKNLKCSSRCFDRILNKNEFFAEFAKQQYGLNVVEESQKTNWSFSPKDIFKNFLFRTRKEYRDIIVGIVGGPVSTFSLCIPKEHLSNRSFVYEAVRIDGRLLDCFPLFSNDIQLRKRAEYTNDMSLYRLISPELQNKSKRVFDYMKSIDYFGDNIRYISTTNREKPNVLLAAAKSYGCSIRHVSNNVRKSYFDTYRIPRHIIYEAVKEEGRALQYVGKESQNDKEIVMLALSNYGPALKYASDIIKKDREVVKTAIERWDGSCLRYADISLRNDFDLALMSCLSLSRIYSLIEILEKNEEKRISYFNMREILGSEILEDRKFVLEMVKIWGVFLRVVGPDFKKDREIVIEAVRNDKDSFRFVDDEKLKNDEELRRIIGIM